MSITLAEERLLVRTPGDVTREGSDVVGLKVPERLHASVGGCDLNVRLDLIRRHCNHAHLAAHHDGTIAIQRHCARVDERIALASDVGHQALVEELAAVDRLILGVDALVKDGVIVGGVHGHDRSRAVRARVVVQVVDGLQTREDRDDLVQASQAAP